MKSGIDDIIFARGPDFVLNLIAQAVDATVSDRAAIDPNQHGYRFDQGSTFHSRENKDGVLVHRRLATFTAVIESEVMETDGLEAKRLFEIHAEVAGHERHFAVPASEFGSLPWVPVELGKEATIIYPTKPQEIVTAIQLLSPHNTVERVRYAHLGWVEDQDIFIHAGGAIGPNGAVPDVEVTLADSLQWYKLELPASDAELRECICTSLDTLKLGPRELTVPLFATVYGAPVDAQHFDSVDYAKGESGSLKSSTAAVFCAHYGRNMWSRRNLPGSFLSTFVALNEQMFGAKDVLFVLDNLVLNGNPHQVAELESKASSIIRAIGDRVRRSRASRDGSLRPAHGPRGAVVITAENLVSGRSDEARLSVLLFKKDDIDKSKLARSQAAAEQGLLAKAMGAYVRWLARDRDTNVLWFRRRAAQILPTFTGEHARLPEAMASKQAALEVFLQFARDSGAISSAEADTHQLEFVQALQKMAPAQEIDRATGRPSKWFLGLLRASVASGRGHFGPCDGGEPPKDKALSYGWKEINRGFDRSSNPLRYWEPSGERLGWIDGESLYLNPEVSLAVVQKLARDTGKPFHITQADLNRCLKDDGLLVETDEKGSRKTLTVRKRVQGIRTGVLYLKSTVLEDD
jgi:hypothetical protein